MSSRRSTIDISYYSSVAAGQVVVQNAGVRAIRPGEFLVGERVRLRLAVVDDANERYVAWLRDPEVHRFLETRFAEQTLESVRAFLASMMDSPHSYLFAIIENATELHIGNVKIGPINAHHAFADVSYYIGERGAWGKGYGTDAVRVVTRFGFERLGLHRCQAGLYESNVGSQRVLEKAGYGYDGRLSKQLLLDGRWEDHVWFAAFRETWR